MVQAGAPKRVWEDAYVRSNTALDIYMLQGEVPEAVMLGGNSDISQFFEHGFYDRLCLWMRRFNTLTRIQC